MTTEWLYLDLRDGMLFEDDGTQYASEVFADAQAAEAWLEENDLRATVR